MQILLHHTPKDSRHAIAGKGASIKYWILTVCKCDSSVFLFKGSDAKFTFTCCFEHKCVLVHIHPIMIKSTQCFLFIIIIISIPINNIPFLKSSCSQLLGCVTSQTQAFSTILDWHYARTFTLDPSWVSCHQFRSRSRQECLLRRDWGVLLLDVITNTAVVITLDIWATEYSGFCLFLKGMPSMIYLNPFMFAQIIYDPASPMEVSMRLY